VVNIKSIRKLLVVLACIALAVVIISSVFRKFQNDLSKLSDTVIEDIDISIIPDGTYEGKYKAFPVSVNLKVTVESGKITAVDIIRHVNGKGEEAESITEEVILRQRIDVDVISGATYSSKVILMAINDALKNR